MRIGPAQATFPTVGCVENVSSSAIHEGGMGPCGAHAREFSHRLCRMFICSFSSSGRIMEQVPHARHELAPEEQRAASGQGEGEAKVQQESESVLQAWQLARGVECGIT